MISIQVWEWVIMLIFRWGHFDRGHFDLIPFNSALENKQLGKNNKVVIGY